MWLRTSIEGHVTVLEIMFIYIHNREGVEFCFDMFKIRIYALFFLVFLMYVMWYIFLLQNGCWQGFRGDDSREENFLFRVERTVHTLSRTECEVFLVNGDLEGLKSDFKMKGCPFQRSCTIYSGNSIVAQVWFILLLSRTIDFSRYEEDLPRLLLRSDCKVGKLLEKQ